MSNNLEKLRLDLEKAQQRRAQLNRRIELLERRVQEAEATQINEMVSNAKVTPEQLAALLQHNAGELPNPDALRAVGAEIMTEEDEYMNFKNIVAGALALVLCGCMASPAFAYVDESIIEQEIPVLDEQEETTEAMGPLTPDGNLTIVDDYSDGTGKHFITMVSKNGNYFYLIIDRDDEGEQTVHFLNMVDESDLLALMDEDEAAKYTEQAETPEPTVTPEPEVETTVEPEQEKSGVNLAPVAILLLAALGGGGYFAYKKYSEKKKAEQAVKPDPDADYTDEEYVLPDEQPTEDEDIEIDLTDDEPV